MKVDVVLPAGGRLRELASETGTEVKALLPLAGTTLLARTVRALRATGRVGRIVVVGPPEVATQTSLGADAVLPEGDSGAENALRGLAWLRGARRPSPRVLILATDLPFVTPEAVTHFLDACPPEAGLCVPVIERQEFTARFPRAALRTVKLRDGQWAIGCAFLVDPEAFARNEALVRRAFAARRSQWAMARLLGLGFILRFLFRQLTMPQIQDKCLQLLGCSGRAIRGCPPELGFDVDYPQDYHYAALRLRLRPAWTALVPPVGPRKSGPWLGTPASCVPSGRRLH